MTTDTLFSNGQAVIKPSGKATLDELIVKILGNNSAVILIGHARSPGNEDVDMKLSELRAEAVKTNLATQAIDDSRIHVANKAELNPIADSDTPQGRAQNRGVEIEVAPTTAID